jgi:Tfp pilus assembly PilM family ATPase/Tfp pilus assembly protein PilN
MPRYVALEWDHSEARVIVARTRTGQVDLEHVLSVPLTAADARSAKELGAKIAAALKDVGVNGGDAIVALGRANVELRFLTVPPVPPDELPDLVRFQATRQFSQPIEDGLIDYAPLTSSGDPPTSVLAAVISPEQLKATRDLCEAARLTPKHLVLRPFAADSLVTRNLSADACVLTVDRLAEEVDLTVALGEQAIFPRSVRVGNYGDAEEQAATLIGEIRRTIAAARNQIADHEVEGVYIFGRESDQKVLGDAVTRDLALPVEFVDPLNVEGVSTAGMRNFPSEVGRFAPLIGALLDESRGRRHEIDFLSPRKRPEPANRKQLYTIVGTAAGVAVLLLVGMVYWQLSSLEREIIRLKDEERSKDKLVQAGKAGVEHAKLIDEFAAGQVAWLDEFKELAEKLPPADRIVLKEITGDIAPKSSEGKLTFDAAARTAPDITELESNLRSERHRVTGSGGSESPTEKQYPWQFRETVTFKPVPPGSTIASAAGEKGKPESPSDKEPAADNSASTVAGTASKESGAPR